MGRIETLGLAFAFATVLTASAVAQELEDKTTAATSGTDGVAHQGRVSGANLSTGGQGPASETKMPVQTPRTNGRENGASQAGAPDATKELFQH